MKKFLLFILMSACFINSGHAFWFDGKYHRTTARGHYVNRTKATFGEIGDWVQLIIPGSALVYSTAIGDWQGNGQLALSYTATWAATSVLKFYVDEERPSQLDSAPHGRSFPSGHTSSAFAGAAYWQRRYGWYVGAPMYAAASFVGYSRVATKMHNWTDVAAGAALGIGFNCLFTSRYNDAATQVSIDPVEGGAYLKFRTLF
ncbi:MAG: phosphatase PAP2 family protein [Rickettsiales bacterium]|jgi:membrane-associated phospholipid phosphatase|nr:phosphatase PAP2 family protein [Rickettsiales bacterium]